MNKPVIDKPVPRTSINKPVNDKSLPTNLCMVNLNQDLLLDKPQPKTSIHNLDTDKPVAKPLSTDLLMTDLYPQISAW